ncbi:glutathione hydrolase 6 [Erpetoichthys calabaricus]|uniref:glutathione hydrolase 6 n=1 Tax=Erpetoichthys calabaricus TaxID=27687 RepID=UPI002234E9D0|nr:glutathione hydrolase 6 [Erpetoichthys calabaricus]
MEKGISVRYSKLQAECEESCEIYESVRSETEHDDEASVRVHLYAPLISFGERNRRKEAVLRIVSSVGLLTVAFIFVFYKLKCGSLQPNINDHHYHQHLEKYNCSYLKNISLNNKDKGHNHEDGGRENDHQHVKNEQVDNEDNEHHSHQGLYHHGVLITDSEICTGVGKDILQAGGNSVDAGVAVLLCLGVVHPHIAGAGGGFSAVFYDKTTGIAKAIEAASTNSVFSRFGFPLVLQGLKLMHKEFGTLEWAPLFHSAIKLSGEGFPVDAILAKALEDSKEHIQNSDLCHLFCDKNGEVKTENSTIINKKLSEFLHNASVLMTDSSYLPETLLKRLAEGLPSSEATFFLNNVNNSLALIKDPSILQNEKYTLFLHSSQNSRRVISEMLNMTNVHNISIQSTVDIKNIASSYVIFLNSAKEIYKSLLNDNVSDEHFTHMGLKTFGSNIGILDRNGNTLVITASMNSSFGSKILSSSTGIIFNDFLEVSNTIPLFWACPSVLQVHNTDETVGIAAIGDTFVPLLIAQIIIKKIYFEKSPEDIVRSSFIHVDVDFNRTLTEYVSGIPDNSPFFKSLREDEAHLNLKIKNESEFSFFLLDAHASHFSAYGNIFSYSDGY